MSFFSHLMSFECHFLQFEDRHDAEDAIRYRDGYDFDGFRLRVSIVSLLFFLFQVLFSGLCESV